MMRQPGNDVTPGPVGGSPDWLRNSVATKLHLTAKSSRTFFEERLAEAGASFATWTVLAALKAKGRVIQRTLARYLGIEGPTLSRHLEAMERRGLITRDRAGADRRAASVEMTAEGDELYARIATVAVASQEHMLQNLTDADVAQLHELLNRILGNVGLPSGMHDS
jgi:MarR family transcriptional regulator, transcriptional regulator for hemolysin